MLSAKVNLVFLLYIQAWRLVSFERSKRRFPDVALYLYNMPYRLACSIVIILGLVLQVCFLDVLDKLQEWVRRTVVPTIDASF